MSKLRLQWKDLSSPNTTLSMHYEPENLFEAVQEALRKQDTLPVEANLQLLLVTETELDFGPFRSL